MKKNLIITILGILAFSISCDDDKLDKVNPNESSPSDFFRTGEQMVFAVNAIYTSLQPVDLFGREYFFTHDMISDEMQVGGALETHRADLLFGRPAPDNTVVLGPWRGWYRVIHQANLVIENEANATEDITPELKARVIGEAKFLRGWAYFDLVTLFGGVPLMKETAKGIEDDKPRATVDEVYALIISDLETAITNLPSKSEYTDAEIARANKQAAQAMLARVYMQRGEYGTARGLLLDVVNSGEFNNWKSVPYSESFREENEFNDESLFEVSFTAEFTSAWDASGRGTQSETTFRGQEYTPSPMGWRNLAPSNNLLAQYEMFANGDGKDDPRYDYTFWLDGESFNNGAGVIDSDIPSFEKYSMVYKQESENQRSGINFRVIRYTEVLLNLAECENALGNDPDAIFYLNEVRSREDVDMPQYPTANYPVNSPEEVFRAIDHERQVELAGEQIRARDILRWRSLGKLTYEPISYFQPNKHELLPIPTTEIAANSKLTQADQNPGY